MYKRKRVFRRRARVAAAGGARKRRPIMRRARRPLVPRNVSVASNFPKLYKLRWCQDVTIQPTGGFLSDTVYSANNLYQPNTVTGTHQPMLYDELKGLYQAYEVIGSKITVRLIGQGIMPAKVLILRNGTSATPVTSLAQATEEGLGAARIITPVQLARSVTLKNYYSQKKFFGVSRQMSFITAFDFAPASQAYFHLMVQNPFGTENLSVNAEVVIDYIVRVHESIVVPQS